MGHMTTYLFLMFAVCTALYLGGFYQSTEAFGNGIGQNADLLSLLISSLTTEKLLVILAASTISTLAAGGSSLARSAVLLTIFNSLTNIFIVPRTLWDTSMVPTMISVPLIMFFNLMTFLIAMELLTERSV